MTAEEKRRYPQIAALLASHPGWEERLAEEVKEEPRWAERAMAEAEAMADRRNSLVIAAVLMEQPGVAEMVGVTFRFVHDGDGLRRDDKTLVYQGKQFGPFTPNQFRLLEAIWDCKRMPVDEVMEAVYGHDADEEEGALKKLRQRLNDQMKRQDCPFHVKSQEEHFILQKRT